MQEKTIDLANIDVLGLLGVQGVNLKLLEKHYPSVKFVQRGSELKFFGETKLLEEVEGIVQLLIEHLEKYNVLTENNVLNQLEKPKASTHINISSEDVLVYGSKGRVIKARTVNQKVMVDAIDNHDMLFAIGPAGTGKTYTAVALAVRALKNKEVRKIILTRPAVEAGENLGFLPGDLKEKLDPYLQPLYDGLRDMIPAAKLEEYIESGTIQIAPLAFMRGRTLDSAFVILDEGQNTTENQMKMFLTRMGRTVKFVITGDISQVDLPRNQKSGLKKAQEVLQGVDGVAFVLLDIQDVVRHKLVKKIIKAFT